MYWKFRDGDAPTLFTNMSTGPLAETDSKKALVDAFSPISATWPFMLPEPVGT